MVDTVKRNDSFQGSIRILFMSIGALILCGALVWCISVRSFSRTAASTQGVVIALNAGGSHPQVRYTTQDGNVVEYSQDGMIFGYKIGDVVSVLYDSQRPHDATFKTFGALWGFPLATFLMGLSFIGLALLQKYRPDLVG